MAEEKDRQQQEQPAEDLTTEMQKELISIAATYTGKPAEKVTLREALDILQKNGELAINGTDYEKAARIGAQIAESYSEMQNVLAGVKETFSNMMRGAATFLQSEEWQRTRDALAELITKAPLWLAIATEISDLEPYIRAEMEKPEYKGMTLEELYQDGTDDNGDIIPGSLFEKLLQAAGAARDTREAQQEGRDLRRQIKKNAQNSGAIMSLQGSNLVTFSARDLWDAFAPGRISKIGTLSQEWINEETGQIEKYQLDKDEIKPVNAMDVSYKAFFLLNTILANSVENYREDFIQNGIIKFYVKGVLDDLDIDPRIRNDGQIDINRKTAGVLYLEREFAPLLSFIGTVPDGSRYSVFNYEGYDINTDTMTIRVPYLFQLWKAAQTAYSNRKIARAERIEAGKKPLKKDQKPLEVNTLFKAIAYKEDDTVLEIAAYITNVMLNAGAGAHKTEISFKTLINNCPRLREKLESIENSPTTDTQKDGKRINKTARYNSELRKIGRACSLIMNPDKCDALKYFSFKSFEPSKIKNGKQEFTPPTKSTLDGKISIKWYRSNPETP